MSGTDDCKEEASGYLELKATKLEYGEITFAIGGDSAADDNAPVVQGEFGRWCPRRLFIPVMDWLPDKFMRVTS